MDFSDKIFEYVYRYRNKEDIIAVILVGSSSQMAQKPEIVPGDIDLFVITSSGKFQERKIVKSEGLEIDINYFPLEVAKDLIESEKMFIVHELANRAFVISQSENAADSLIDMAKKKYEKGPMPLPEELVALEMNQLKGLIEGNSKEADPVQNRFSRIIIFERLIKAYFTVNAIWLPKEKRILKELKKINPRLYTKSSEFLECFELSKLEDIYCEVFGKRPIVQEISLVYSE
ncbi:hypothetical protein SAMN02745945_02315 [Peptoclostridium litorale DSM 5388]|uniref:Polymerase nucleotidyl transferase domain-containing protein n=1 Tax=Peptoclostridium litorale DSM 5388 TaxID=1121324 RepID=A0A069RBJ0_PEPLI|nr:hypothetical protein [Peptoclostridium litorale]KDR94416.1 hypothetical protein CLIT_20c00610 [Peptoclostridium litorale DSM 5388]SIO24256.1 hypothetical protein SAMN02745945_02315 [Peptoclostridium litorale DSM 5388]